MAQDLDQFAAFARSLAAAARCETLPGSRDGWAAAENKRPDGFDPVTQNDRNAELAIRRLIEAQYPDHGITGEEFPARLGAGPYSWSLDPIDGTRAYICGLPSWTTLIALLEEGEPVLGAVDVPRLDELYLGYGAKAVMVSGGGREQRPLATSGCRSISEARLSTTDPCMFVSGEAEGFQRLRREARLTRYGLDAYGYALVAAGSIDLIAESNLKPHDFNALVPLVRAAGGAVSNWSGGSDISQGQIVAAASEALLDEACRLLSV
jgi:myo-inositol-1(or 4)-monophosphatase